MPSPVQSGSSLASRHFCYAASTIRASTLATSHDYPILLLSAASLGASTYPCHSVVRFYFFSADSRDSHCFSSSCFVLSMCGRLPCLS
jgi:hypothetical protein